MAISTKQFKILASEFGVNAADLKDQAHDEGITTAVALRAFLEADTGTPATINTTDDAAADAHDTTDAGTTDDAGKPADDKPVVTDASNAPSWYTDLGYSNAEWRRLGLPWATGSSATDLPALIGRDPSDEDKRIAFGIWKSGGKGMNLAKFSRRWAAQAATATA